MGKRKVVETYEDKMCFLLYCKYVIKEKRYPTLRELQEEWYLNSTSAVSYRLDRLIALNYIEKNEKARHASIKIKGIMMIMPRIYYDLLEDLSLDLAGWKKDKELEKEGFYDRV